MFLISSLTLHVRLSRRWAFFCQSLAEINIAVQQVDEVGREVKLWSHIDVKVSALHRNWVSDIFIAFCSAIVFSTVLYAMPGYLPDSGATCCITVVTGTVSVRNKATGGRTK